MAQQVKDLYCHCCGLRHSVVQVGSRAPELLHARGMAKKKKKSLKNIREWRKVWRYKYMK